ncbi:Subunit of Outer Membrane Protein Assembly Complex: BamB [Serratia symbiotica str. 'Cinara cedri']|nr:Subunit of Outer Membrane Protein Assembly Complex: BamB [Serratia symbiotica str. 'Cinara cedri']
MKVIFMQLHKTLFVVLVFAAFLSGCSLLLKNEDVVTMSPLPKVKNQFTPNKIWSTSIGDGTSKSYSHLRPSYQKNTIFAADHYGIVKALNAISGIEKWKVDLSKHTNFSLSGLSTALLLGNLVASGDKIYISSEKAVVYALNTSDGSVAWISRVAGEAISCPVISNGMVFIHTSNGNLQALNASNGKVRWTINLDMPFLSLRGESAPAVAFGVIIIGDDNGYVNAILMETGQLIWRQRISQPSSSDQIAHLNDVDTTPVIIEDIVYALGYNGNLTALDLRSGRIIFQRKLSSVHDFIVNAGYIYLVDQHDRLLALNAKSGVTIWIQNDLLYRKLTPPVMFHGYLLTGDAKGYLHWVDPASGRFIAQQLVDKSGFLSTPLVAGDKLFIQARSGKVHALTG